jgi:hypothetical protein
MQQATKKYQAYSIQTSKGMSFSTVFLSLLIGFGSAFAGPPPPCTHEQNHLSISDKLLKLVDTPHQLKGAMSPEVDISLKNVVDYFKRNEKKEGEKNDKHIETQKNTIPCISYTMTEVKVGNIKLANGEQAPREFQGQLMVLKSIAEGCVAHQQIKGAFWIELEKGNQGWNAHTIVNATAKKQLQKCLENEINKSFTELNHTQVAKVYVPIYFNQVGQ